MITKDYVRQQLNYEVLKYFNDYFVSGNYRLHHVFYPLLKGDGTYPRRRFIFFYRQLKKKSIRFNYYSIYRR